ncbi:gas vesicle protein GvpG [Streptosporangium sandarakinum]|uniref:Gas vesicle protein G n=1 Tax=Streptosporangium pseudovulgare TaxID=35765 RepID=A0ABQ2QKJ2_9ACTN|nr:gas vesicle protein GvpG [Streptosporangium pseudovulgare]GGP84833.1 hypothetical protein GCM10010140_12510 [Streptosporangium pseudovulgare]
MDLLFDLTVGLPLLPLRALVKIAEVIQDQAEMELHHPAAVRRQLEDLEEARRSGEISEEEERQAMTEILERMVTQPDLPRGAPAPYDGEEE